MDTLDQQDSDLYQTREAVKEEKCEAELDIDVQMSLRTGICIVARNKYSSAQIQRDFAAGIRDLDNEAAMEKDPDNFDANAEMRNYDEVAKNLKVFCVSSRAYQKLRGRLEADDLLKGFIYLEDTQVSQYLVLKYTLLIVL